MFPGGKAEVGLPLPIEPYTVLQVSLPPAARGLLDLERSTSLFLPEPSVALVEYAGTSSEARVLAYSLGGTLYLRERVDSGEWLAGFLDVDMVPTADTRLDWGAACAEGIEQCGQSIDARCHVGSSGAAFCTEECNDDDDCTDDLVCSGDHCLLPCDTDADCPSHLECDASEAPGGCQ